MNTEQGGRREAESFRNQIRGGGFQKRQERLMAVLHKERGLGAKEPCTAPRSFFRGPSPVCLQLVKDKQNEHTGVLITPL